MWVITRSRRLHFFLKPLERDFFPRILPFIFVSFNLFHSMRFQTTVIRAAKYRLAKNDILQGARADFRVLNFAKLYRKTFRSFVKISGMRKLLKRCPRGSSRYYLKIEDSFQHLHRLSTIRSISPFSFIAIHAQLQPSS